jgi:F-type H+-transporting ATPase subunit b
MPQLDTSTFSSQIFWLGMCFVVLYGILAYFLMPKITAILENRETIREKNINIASTYREEAEGLLVEYESLLAQTRQGAHEKYQEVVAATALEMAKKKKEMLDKLQERLRVAEQDLYRARVEASTEMHSVAQDIAGDILHKLTGQVYSQAAMTAEKDKT